jgi:hypothetical protein
MDARTPPVSRQSLEEIRREARDNWLRMRFGERTTGAEIESPIVSGSTRDDDLVR